MLMATTLRQGLCAGGCYLPEEGVRYKAMPFPESERVIYNKNPLAEVICQLRFPTILRIGTGDVADFQERIRQDYPLYEAREPSIEFPELPQQFARLAANLQIPKTAQLITHRFSTADGGRSISLSQDFVALVESQYAHWESFREEMQKAETALREVYKPAFYSRIGLRYRDVISRNTLGIAGAKWKSLLKEHIVGVLGAEDICDQVQSLETVAVVGLPDLAGGRVRIAHGLVEAVDKEQCYYIDSDYWMNGSCNPDESFRTLDKFNRVAGRLFRWAITTELHNAMEPNRI